MSSSRNDVLRVSTADNVGIGYDVAGLGSRFIAQLVDGLVLAVILVVVAVTMAAIINPGDGRTTVLAALAIGGVSLIVYVAYFAACELGSGGRTPGKSAAGLRVIGIDGSAATPAQLVLRNVARIIDMVGGVGVVVMFINGHSRRVGDLLAGTVVVRARPTASLAAIVAPPPVLLRTPDPGPAVDGLEHLGEPELAAIRAFLARPGLEPALRTRLAADITRRLVERMRLPSTAPERLWPPELFLERLYLQLSQRLARDP